MLWFRVSQSALRKSKGDFRERTCILPLMENTEVMRCLYAFLDIEILAIATHNQCRDSPTEENHTKGDEYNTDRYQNQ